MARTSEPIILASASVSRANLLRAAGAAFTIEPAAIDETTLKRQARQGGASALGCATTLAAAKAVDVSRRRPGALVVGADQILAAGAKWFDKPADLDDARRQLLRLRGRTHVLATAVVVTREGERLWHAASTPRLTMRRFSDAFLEEYIAAEGGMLLASVGAYRLEGRGAQLFERISGDYFAVLGLPLIELLGFLRGRGAIPA